MSALYLTLWLIICGVTGANSRNAWVASATTLASFFLLRNWP